MSVEYCKNCDKHIDTDWDAEHICFEFEELKQENYKLREEIYTLVNEYMMSDERDDVMEKINLLIENELKQEDLCE